MGSLTFLRVLPLLVGCYLIGAIPFGYLISRFIYGVDIRKFGSGNPGATNVWRTLGKNPGLATLALDIAKGAIPVLLSKSMFPQQDGLAVLSGLLSIVGHNWSLFLHGGGGKGVATSAGVFLALIPLHAVIALVTFMIFFVLFKRVSIGSLSGSIALLTSVFVVPVSLLIQVTVVVASLMILIKHIPNIKRIRAGTEPKVNFK